MHMFKKTLKIQEMLEAEDWIDQNWDDLIGTYRNHLELSVILKLNVQYVEPEMLDSDVLAVLAPPEADDGSLGLIKISNIFKNTKFSYMHEIIHYVRDVGIGIRVQKTYARKKMGVYKEHSEQIIDYYAAAADMRYRDIKIALKDFDQSKPKMDELVFLQTLCEKYGQERQAVIRRIKEVRRLYRARTKSQ